MKSFESADEILDFAIMNEEEAFAFYSDLAKESKNPQIKIIFQELAEEEKSHKEKLLEVKMGKTLKINPEKISDMHISDYIVDVEPNDDMNYQDALVLAMKKEKKAFELYANLADETDNDMLENIFLSLAKEEAKHKLKLEIEYDEFVLKEN